MIVCTKCGFQNEEGSAFCGSCSSFLEWTGAKIGEEAAPPPVDEAPHIPPPVAERHGLLDRVKDAVGLGGATTPGAPAEGQPGAAPSGFAGEAFEPGQPVGGQPAIPDSAAPAVVRTSRVYRAIEDADEAAPEPEQAPAAEPEPAEPLPAEPALAAAAAPPPAAPFAPPPATPFAPPAWAAPATASGTPPTAPSPTAGAPAWAAPAQAAPAEAAPAVAAPAPAESAPSAPATPAATPPAQVPPARPAPLIRPATPADSASSLIRPARPITGPARKPLVEAGPAPVIPQAAPPMAKPAPVQPPAQPPSARPVAQPPAQKRPATAPPAAAAPAVPGATPALAGQPGAVAPTDQPSSVKPTAVKPGPPERRIVQAPRATADTPAPNPGDLVCGNCGIGNDPARKFCRRCGQSLAEAAVVAAPKVAWYRRIFGRKPKQAVAAGQRPKSMRTDAGGGSGSRSIGKVISRVIQVVVVITIVGGAAGYGLNIGGMQGIINGAISNIVGIFVPKVDPVRTSGTATGPGTKGHAAQALFDGTVGYWAAPFAADAPPAVGATFTPAVTINKVRFVSGATGDEFAKNARPRSVTIDFFDAAGITVLTKTFVLIDSADNQDFDAGAKGVTRITVTVREVFVAQNAKAPVAMTEMQFFGAREGAAASVTPAP